MRAAPRRARGTPLRSRRADRCRRGQRPGHPAGGRSRSSIVDRQRSRPPARQSPPSARRRPGGRRRHRAPVPPVGPTVRAARVCAVGPGRPGRLRPWAWAWPSVRPWASGRAWAPWSAWPWASPSAVGRPSAAPPGPPPLPPGSRHPALPPPRPARRCLDRVRRCASMARSRARWTAPLAVLGQASATRPLRTTMLWSTPASMASDRDGVLSTRARAPAASSTMVW